MYYRQRLIRAISLDKEFLQAEDFHSKGGFTMSKQEERAVKMEERAQALLQEAAQLRKQIEARRLDQENRAFERQQKAWGRRPRETHLKILLGVAALSLLRGLPPEEKSNFAGKLLSRLGERDRAALIELQEFRQT